MNLYTEVFTFFILSCFAFMICTLLIMYNRSLGKEEQHLCEDLSILLTAYFIIANSTQNTILMISIPLLIAYLEDRKLPSVCVTLALMYYSYVTYGFNLYVLIIIYTLFFTSYQLYRNKKLSVRGLVIFFALLKTTSFWIFSTNNVFSKEIIYEPNQIIMITITYIVGVATFYFLYDKTKSIAKLYMSIKEVEDNKQIRQTLFKITHEIKNPLAVCKGYLDMYDPNNNEHTEKFIPIVKKEIEKTLTILQDFLSLTKTNLQKESMDINYLIEDCIDSMNLLLEYQNVTVIKDLEDNEIYISGDYNRLHQVFVNIIKNSVEALEKVKIKEIHIKSRVIEKHVVIEVEDNGCGMSKETATKINEPFYTTKKEGTGLGVPLSIEIINAHDGIMAYSTIPKKQTKVTITLPLETRKNNF